MPIVYEAINHLQNTQWQVNKRVLDVVKALWEEGRTVAELPDREDEPLIPYPYPDRAMVIYIAIAFLMYIIVNIK